jgi:hypothetical protein
MTDAKSWWGQAQIKPELREFITLSSRDIHDLTQEAAKAADPVARLSELLNERGAAKKAIREGYEADRMKEDAAKIQDIPSWPGPVLHMKSQPWIERKCFGVMYSDDLLMVLEAEIIPHYYTSIEELVKVWSVD